MEKDNVKTNCARLKKNYIYIKLEYTGKLRTLKKGNVHVLQQEIVKLTLERAIKIWIDVPIVEDDIK